jgi:hypothetical protein
MNPAELERKLIAAARSKPPGDRVPYAFEKRVMALLQTTPVLDYRELWGRALWRAAVACLALMLFLGALSLVTPRKTSSNDLSQDFENTMLASVSQDTDSASSW